MGIWEYPLLTLLGAGVGAYGTLIGAGGGILLVPALLLLYPHESPSTIASISLAVVFLNALSGTLAYGHMHRIDYRAGLLFGAATVPGAVLGAYATSLLSRQLFDLLFSFMVLALAIFILARPAPERRPPRVYRRHVTHTLVDFKGTSYSYSFSKRLGVLLSLVIGAISSMLGIGGGPFLVPVLVYILHFPLHVATATSQVHGADHERHRQRVASVGAEFRARSPAHPLLRSWGGRRGTSGGAAVATPLRAEHQLHPRGWANIDRYTTGHPRL